MGKNFLARLFGGKNKHTGSSPTNATDPIMSQIVIDTISDGIAIIDSAGIILLFNPAATQLTGWPTDHAVGLDYRSVFNLYNNADRELDNTDNPIAIAYTSRTTTENDKVYIKTASGKRIQIRIKVTPIIRSQNNETKIDGIVAVFQDITRERAEQNAQTDFISTASHEMRTPVATIEGYLGMILNPKICSIDNNARDYATKAHASIKHLGRLFQDLLDVTKADDNRMVNNPTLIDAVIATRELTNSFISMAAEKNITLQFKPDTTSSTTTGASMTVIPPSIIYVDLDHFNEALGNIIENAIKYTIKGSVTVDIDNVDGKTRISVTDTGIGIPAEDVPHLFQKFYRVDNSETREIGGTGLGLYLIKKLVTSMGGNVGVKSDYGDGSTFWMEFDNLTRQQVIQKAHEIKARNDASGMQTT